VLQEQINNNFNFFEGEILAIDKPIRITSFQAVSKIKWAAKQYLNHHPDQIENKQAKLRVGHAGTLDPLATGVLLVCTGKKTKAISSLQQMEKEYTGTFFIGATTPCFDLEREVDATYPIDHISEAIILETAKKFTGVILQKPPAFSAVKIQGKRAYELARKGIEVEIPGKEIEIKSFEITDISMPLVTFRIVCSKGTYIRSIARDFGTALNSGAHLTKLCRTRIGNYALNNCYQLTELMENLVKQP
jgi:tRNA pseudouridine55 synthase